ncbi:hypothetical protein NC651_012188 [Populus alba x Populus x berolinensis]|nr:hypothetical protein NC651_012188 [Populus alba x Populus x berolinensis]
MATDTAPSHQTPSDHEEKSEVGKQVEKPKTEVIEKPEEPLEVIPIKSDALVVKDAEDSEPVFKEDDKPESELVILKWRSDKVEAVAPEPSEVKMESEVTEQVEKTGEKSVEAIEKTQDSSEVHPIKESEAVAVKDIDDSVAVPKVDKPESAVPEVEVKQEEQSEVIEQVEKPESAVPQVEVKLVEQPEAEGTDPVEVLVKEVVVEAEKGGEEKEAQTTKDEGENIASETLKEELAHPIKVEDVSDAVSNAKVTEKSFEGEKTVENVVPAVEDKKEEIPAGEETEKDQKNRGKAG